MEENFSQLIARTQTVMNRRLLKNFKQADFSVTPEQFMVLNILWENEGMSQQDISCSTGKDKPSITRIVDNLEKAGFVKRHDCPNDRRKNLIFLTDEGKAIKNEIINLSEITSIEMLKDIDQSHLEECKKVLKQVINNSDNC